MKANRRPEAQTKTAAPTYYTVSEAAELLRARRWTIAAAIREKKLPYIRMGKKFVLMRADLDAFALANRVDAPNKRG
jgi:excisionase family DNA binding protein